MFSKAMLRLLLVFRFNFILCELIFQDHFDEIDSNKWNVIAGKARCKEHEFEFPGNNQPSCNTNNEVNLRATWGKLVITAREEDYFNKQFTTATIISNDTFALIPGDSSLLFRVKASLPIVKGFIPRIYLSNGFQSINILNYNDYLWRGLIRRTKISKLIKNINLTEFQDYEMIFDKSVFIWNINGKEFIRKKINETRPSMDANNFSYDDQGKFRLLITVNIAKNIFDLEKGSISDEIEETTKREDVFDSEDYELDQTCKTFIIDYIKVYNYSQVHFTPIEYEDDEKASEICTEINDLSHESYIKFVPNRELDLVLNEEFNDTSLDENTWVNIGSDDKCQDSPGNETKSCEPPGNQNIEVSDGKLKLFLKNENYLKYNFTGASISSRHFYKNARIEIRAKLANGLGYVSEISMKTYEKGNVNGYVYIFHRNGCDRCIFSGYKMTQVHPRGVSYEGTEIDFKTYHTFGIEWSESYIQWFIDDQVVYQVNRIYDNMGRLTSSDHVGEWYLPFEHEFNLQLRIGINRRFTRYVRNGTSHVLEIDSVKVYGEIIMVEIDINVKQQGKVDTKMLPIIIAISLVMAVMTVLLIILFVLWKKQKKRNEHAQNAEMYDDIEDIDDVYDDTQIEDGIYAEYQYQYVLKPQEYETPYAVPNKYQLNKQESGNLYAVPNKYKLNKQDNGNLYAVPSEYYVRFQNYDGYLKMTKNDDEVNNHTPNSYMVMNRKT